MTEVDNQETPQYKTEEPTPDTEEQQEIQQPDEKDLLINEQKEKQGSQQRIINLENSIVLLKEENEKTEIEELQNRLIEKEGNIEEWKTKMEELTNIHNESEEKTKYNNELLEQKDQQIKQGEIELQKLKEGKIDLVEDDQINGNIDDHQGEDQQDIDLEREKSEELIKKPTEQEAYKELEVKNKQIKKKLKKTMVEKDNLERSLKDVDKANRMNSHELIAYEQTMENMEYELKMKRGLIEQLEDKIREMEMLQSSDGRGNESEFILKIQENEELIMSMQDDMKSLVDFKNELEQLIEDQQKQLSSKSQKNNQLQEALEQIQEEMFNKDELLGKLSKQAEGNKLKVKNTQQQLKQYSESQMRDATKKIRDKIGEVDVLKDMLKSANKQIKSKDMDQKRLLTKIDKLEKINDIQHRSKDNDIDYSVGSKRSNNGSVPRAPYTGVIQEVDENLESTTKLVNRQSQQNPFGRDNSLDQLVNKKRIESMSPHTPGKQKVKNTLPELNKNPEHHLSPPKRHKKSVTDTESKMSDQERTQVQQLNSYNKDTDEIRQKNFKSKYNQTIHEYTNNLTNQNFRNNSHGMRGVFSQDKDLELPVIVNSCKSVQSETTKQSVMFVKRDGVGAVGQFTSNSGQTMKFYSPNIVSKKAI